jgi:hypothetical protein
MTVADVMSLVKDGLMTIAVVFLLWREIRRGKKEQ